MPLVTLGTSMVVGEPLAKGVSSLPSPPHEAIKLAAVATAMAPMVLVFIDFFMNFLPFYVL